MHVSGLEREKNACSPDQQRKSFGKVDLVVTIGLGLAIGLGLQGMYRSASSAYEAHKIEASKVLAFSKKSEAHTFGAQLMLACSDQDWDVKMKTTHCLSQAVGQASIERGSAFGEEVKAAVLDIDTFMKSSKASE